MIISHARVAFSLTLAFRLVVRAESLFVSDNIDLGPRRVLFADSPNIRPEGAFAGFADEVLRGRLGGEEEVRGED